MTRAAIYARVSSPGQEEKQTIQSQLTACREYCAAHGHDVVATLTDEAVSGATPFGERPAGRELLTLVTAGEVECAVIYCPDRLGRDVYEVLGAQRELTRLKATIEFCVQSFDDTIEGKFTFQVMLAVAELERGLITRRTSEGRAHRVRDGKWATSIVPFGYAYDPATGLLSPHPEHADIVRQIFAWAAGGEGLSAIATRLEKMGVAIPLPPGKAHIVRKREWHVSTIHKMLRAERYIGKATYNGQPMVCPALVDEALFAAATEQMTERGHRLRGKITRQYLLRGLVRCRFCGGPCRSTTDAKANGWTRAVYSCRNRSMYPKARAEHAGIKGRWGADVVEGAVKRWVLALLRDPARALAQARLYEADAATRMADAQRDRDQLAQRLRDVDVQEARVLDGWRKGIYRDEAQFDIALAAVRADRAALECERSGNGKGRARSRPKANPAIDAALVRRAAKLMKGWPRDPVLDDMMLQVVSDHQWAGYVKALVRAVWLEPDGKHVSVEGIIPASVVEDFSPRS